MSHTREIFQRTEVQTGNRTGEPFQQLSTLHRRKGTGGKGDLKLKQSGQVGHKTASACVVWMGWKSRCTDGVVPLPWASLWWKEREAEVCAPWRVVELQMWGWGRSSLSPWRCPSPWCHWSRVWFLVEGSGFVSVAHVTPKGRADVPDLGGLLPYCCLRALQSLSHPAQGRAGLAPSLGSTLEMT